ncbi:hypothetical protein SDC9_41282 [bioreactor metagenome]|jgi:hypothetical protein|uniref:BREX system P-loop protein BrxC n=2 Tax=root TaxID=1 RepID=A0A644VUR7_9ZZZZ
MERMGSLFAKPVERHIEEVIKVNQDDEKALAIEMDEYVATDSIRESYIEVFKEIAEGPSAPREGIGIWISGFFGSGKSSFAKMLGYTVANRTIGASCAADLFKKTANDPRISDLLDSINRRIPFESVIFDVSMDSGRSGTERLTEILYKSLLKGLDYATDFDIAELEIALEGDGRLERFERLFEEKMGSPWRLRRQLGLAINEASVVLNALDPRAFPTPDSWAVSVGAGRADIDPNRLAERAFELSSRRKKGKALLFVIDEVGQFVSRSVDKMLDLQAIIQAFGVAGKNRTERRQAVSPFWIAVTSQEKLNEVVTALDSRRIELARLQDRFRVNVDLRQTDISEITARRVLEKNAEAGRKLGALFDANAGRIRECCTLERTSRNGDISREEFIRLYPYLPYQIDLCIDIVSGLRLKRGAQRHVGGSNRTIIKQAQQMLINERTKLVEAPIGTLVTLDKVYELLEAGSLIPYEITNEISSIGKRLPAHPSAVRVARAIALLESVKDLPRTVRNIAVVLHPTVTSPSREQEIEDALNELERAQFVRNTEEGYKLLTVQEKNWETKRNGLDPREAERNAIHREIIKEVYSDPKLRVHPYENLRSFKLGITMAGETVEGDGDIFLHLHLAPEAEVVTERTELRSRSAERPDEIFCSVALPQAARDTVAELYRSREMVAEADRLAAQQKLTAEEGACLAEEKNRKDRISRQLKKIFLEALAGGVFYFRGVERKGVSLGTALPDMMRELVALAVPLMFEKLRTGALPLSSGDVDKFLVAANLSALPSAFYDENAEKSLVVKQGGTYVPNTSCSLCREIMEHLDREHTYGNQVTGKNLEARFGGKGYAWNLESIRAGLAVLFRGGALEISHQGKKYTQYTEPAVRVVFQNTPPFRAASFAPRRTVDLKLRVAAAKMLEEIVGKMVEPEENAICSAFRKESAEEKTKLVPVHARLTALNVPGADMVTERMKRLDEILASDGEECIKTLASSGRTFLQNRKEVSELAAAATDKNLEKLGFARRILKEQWPVLSQRGADGSLATSAGELASILESENCLANVEKMKVLMKDIHEEYRKIYLEAWKKRRSAFEKALETLKGNPEWVTFDESPDISAELKENLLNPIREKAQAEAELPLFATVCQRTGVTVSQLESEAESTAGVVSKTLARIVELIAPEEKVERIVVSSLCRGRIATEDELEDFIQSLHDRMEKIIAGGGTIILE